MFCSVLSMMLLLGMVQGQSNPKRLWQLGEKAGAYEPEKGNDAIFPKLYDTMYVGTGPSEINFKAFSFDGTSDYAKVKINTGDQFKTWSWHIWVYPVNLTGTLLYYMKDGSGSGWTGIDSVTIQINNGNIRATVRKGSTKWIVQQNSTITINSWHRIIFTRNMDASAISISVDGVVTTAHGPSKADAECLGQPGDAWIARKQSVNFKFHGKITCFLMYDYIFKHRYGHPYADNYCKAMMNRNPSKVVVREP